jgi:uncharacterized protein (UPF0333 family)
MAVQILLTVTLVVLVVLVVVVGASYWIDKSVGKRD